MRHSAGHLWLTAARMRGYSLIVLSLSAIAMIVWIALSRDGIDLNGKPLGTDFASFYAAGSLALEGRGADAYDGVLHLARQRFLFGGDAPYYGWFYPPIFLLLAAALAALPYAFALALWQSATLALYLGVIGLILRAPRSRNPDIARGWWLPALGFPAVLVNFGHGQNGFLTAALLGGALAFLPTRPWIAGVLFGLLSYKPQFALVIPLALLCAGYGRIMAAAAATTITLAGLATLVFGMGIWLPFFDAMGASRRLVLEGGDVGFEKFQSAFAAVRLWGGSIGAAYVLQGVVSLAAIFATLWVWRASRDVSLRAAVLILSTLLASPHVLDYDLMLLAPAIAFFVAQVDRRNVRPWEINLLAIAWSVPLVARVVMGTTGLPLGFLVVSALFAMALRRAAMPPEAVTIKAPILAQA